MEDALLEPPPHNDFTEVDFDFGESEELCDEKSLDSSITNYRHKYSRRYYTHTTGRYHIPNDKLKQQHLDIQHSIYFKTFRHQLT
jgi:hypothetical protein